MFGLSLFPRSRERRDALRLYEAIVAVSRRPWLYGPDRAPDTVDGRWEMLTAHAALALIRLRQEPSAGMLGELFADTLFRGVDSGLREAGVGDLSVPRQMRRLAQAFYGRVQAYDAAGEDLAALSDALARNVWNADAHPFAASLAAHLMATRRSFESKPLSRLSDPSSWPTPAS